MKRIFFIFWVFFCSSSIFADTNSVWHFVKDIRGGVFGSDEIDNSNYTFQNNVYFEENIELNSLVKFPNYSTVSRPYCNSLRYGQIIFDLDQKKLFVCTKDYEDAWKPLDSDFDSDGIVEWKDWDDNNNSKIHVNLTPENVVSGISLFGILGTMLEGPGIECNNGFLSINDCKVTIDNKWLANNSCQNGMNNCYVDSSLGGWSSIHCGFGRGNKYCYIENISYRDYYSYLPSSKQGIFDMFMDAKKKGDYIYGDVPFNIANKATKCSNGNSGRLLAGYPTGSKIEVRYGYITDNSEKEINICRAYCGAFGANYWSYHQSGGGNPPSSTCECAYSGSGAVITSGHLPSFWAGTCS